MSSKIERFAPLAGGLIALLIALRYLPVWRSDLIERGENISNAFGPVFDFATFSAGSLFAIYVLALSRPDGFVGRIFETRTFRLFHGYVSKAIALNIVLSIWSAINVIRGIGSVNAKYEMIFSALWVGLAVWAFFSVVRVVLLFMVIVGKGGVSNAGKPLGKTS